MSTCVVMVKGKTLSVSGGSGYVGGGSVMGVQLSTTRVAPLTGVKCGNARPWDLPPPSFSNQFTPFDVKGNDYYR